MSNRLFPAYAVALMLFTASCSSLDDAAESRCNLEIYYFEADVPGDYQKLETTEIVVSDSLFDDINSRLFREIRRRALILKADAVVVGDSRRSHSQCACCRSHVPASGGPHVATNVLFLRKQNNAQGND